MPEAGSSTVATLTVDPYDTTTMATVQVFLDGQPVLTPLGPTSGDGGHTWQAVITWPSAGDFEVVWTVTGTGTGRKSVDYSVGPSGQQISCTRQYATTTDLANWLGTAPPPAADRLLCNATVLLDQILHAAVYDVDTNDMPTDPQVIAALRDACCELVAWWGYTGDPHGARQAVGGASIGDVSLGSGGGSTTRSPAAARVGPQVVAILATAGLLYQPVVTW